jgi:K+-transporting ATPase KdpF subunit
MSGDDAVGLVITVLLAAYLLYTLMRPESI